MAKGVGHVYGHHWAWPPLNPGMGTMPSEVTVWHYARHYEARRGGRIVAHVVVYTNDLEKGAGMPQSS